MWIRTENSLARWDFNLCNGLYSSFFFFDQIMGENKTKNKKIGETVFFF